MPDLVPHPINDKQMSLTTRFRHVVDDGFGWGSVSGILGRGSHFSRCEKGSCSAAMGSLEYFETPIKLQRWSTATTSARPSSQNALSFLDVTKRDVLRCDGLPWVFWNADKIAEMIDNNYVRTAVQNAFIVSWVHLEAFSEICWTRFRNLSETVNLPGAARHFGQSLTECCDINLKVFNLFSIVAILFFLFVFDFVLNYSFLFGFVSFFWFQFCDQTSFY